MAKQPRITVLQPDPGVPLARFDEWLRDAGVRFGVVSLWDKDVPQLASAGEGLLVLGGRMSALDRAHHPWLDPLGDLLADAHSIDLPILGIGLGHQILAAALGGEIEVDAAGGPEEGPVTVEWLPGASDDPVLGATAAAGAAPLAQSHRDVVTRLPEGAIELARTQRYPNHAFRLGSAWGVQFHPEATPELVAKWSDGDRTHRAALVERLNAAEPGLTAASRPVAGGFAEYVRKSV